MNPVFRAVIVFVILFIVLRLSGRRTLAEITTFDFILLLIIGDITQQAIVGDDYSITTMAMVITTVVLLDLLMGRLAMKSRRFGHLLESVPVIVIDNGKVLQHAMDQEGVDLEEILAAARELHGLAALDDIKYAIVERHGGISIVPKSR
jgi:uncharacterized membrane protein YcaP (DUF421 family)